MQNKNKKVYSKLYVIIFLVTIFSIEHAHPSLYAEGLSGHECGVSCHRYKKDILLKMTFKSECIHCHSSDNNTPYNVENFPRNVDQQNSGEIFTGTFAATGRNNYSIALKPAKNEYHDMALIPEGEFIMGSNDRWDDESPEFISKTGAFYIDIYEVSNSKYKIFINETHYPPPILWDGNKIPERLVKHPVTYVSWDDASTFCRWAEKRLPTEAEWEKAARGKTGYTFPWGNVFDPYRSNNPQNGSKGTKNVGSFDRGKSPYGLYDMSGNVWEWTSSWYQPHPGNNISNPKYGKKNRVIKGGSWFDCLGYGCGISAPAYNRGAVVPTTRNNTTGFRCAKDLK